MRFWGLLVFSLLGLAVLLSLGIWQVQRLAWKQAVLAEINAHVTAQPVNIPDVGLVDSVYHRMLPVSVTGQFTDAPFVRVLVSQKIYGAGYRIINSFQTDDGRVILVDRGYVKIEDGVDVPTGPVTLTGNLYWPDEIDSFTPENDVANNIWFARDVSQMANHFGSELVFLVLRSSDPDTSQVKPLPISSSGIPNDHLQYAITWFSLAAIWLAMMGYLLYRDRKGPITG